MGQIKNIKLHIVTDIKVNMSSEEDSDIETSEEEEEEEEEDEKNSIKATKPVPKDIILEDEIFHVACHPTKNVIACGEISGKVSIHSYSSEGDNSKLLENTEHAKACRNVTFTSNGERLYTSSKDKSIHILDLNTGTTITKLEAAHEKAINCVNICDPNYFLSGSDDGVVKMWDTRTFTAIAEFGDFKDFVSAMECTRDNKTLLCTSGDGVLTVINLRKRVVDSASDQLDEELLSVGVMKNQTKVICGSGEGVINIYNWGEWGDISDRIPAEKDSIDCLHTLTEDIVLTGGGNGRINAWYVLPHKHLGSIGGHGKMGLQSLSASHDAQVLVSAAGEKTVKFWDVSGLHNITPPSAQEKSRKRKLEVNEDRNDFFDDL